MGMSIRTISVAGVEGNNSRNGNLSQRRNGRNGNGNSNGKENSDGSFISSTNGNINRNYSSTSNGGGDMPGQTTTVEGNHDMWSTRIVT